MRREYIALFMQIRMLADELGDHRSLVALAALFERHGRESIEEVLRSIETRAHNRNNVAA